MKKNDIVEKKIIASLEASDQKPNPHILDAAKKELRARKTPSKRIVYRYAFAACAVIVICLAIVLPLTLKGNDGDMQELQYSSMYDYFKEKNIDINTYDHLFDKNMGSASGTPIEKSPYAAEECILVQSKGRDIYIKQKYNFSQTDTITVSVLLVDDEDITQATFGEFSNLEKSTRFMKVDISYTFDIESKTGKVAFVYNEKDFYIELACDSESVMINHIQALIISQ